MRHAFCHENPPTKIWLVSKEKNNTVAARIGHAIRHAQSGRTSSFARHTKNPPGNLHHLNSPRKITCSRLWSTCARALRTVSARLRSTATTSFWQASSLPDTNARAFCSDSSSDRSASSSTAACTSSRFFVTSDASAFPSAISARPSCRLPAISSVSRMRCVAHVSVPSGA